MPIQPPNANLRAELARADLSQTAVADLLGITQGQVSLRIRGKMPWRVAELQKLSRHLNVPIAALLDDEPADPDAAERRQLADDMVLADQAIGDGETAAAS